jgi:hypothetical protein
VKAVENPITPKVWWALGLTSAAAAVGLGAWALTRPGGASGTAQLGTSTFTSTLTSSLQAVEAMDPTSLCSSNATVTAFQTAWNASGQSTQLTVDGDYGPNTAAAAQSLDSNAPAACAGMAAG